MHRNRMYVRMECVGHHLQAIQEAGPGPAKIGIAIRDIYLACIDGRYREANLLIQHLANIFKRPILRKAAAGNKKDIGFAGSHRVPG